MVTEGMNRCFEDYHDWQDVTAHGDTELHFICANCPNTKTEPRRPFPLPTGMAMVDALASCFGVLPTEEGGEG